ncbi:YibE/F family protein [Fundidesulfovibrio agrisoli]|uniref:YibE/F family protein n=1 Tax=Fundidesulfovibrio agrisoli TaxID=2922717 RepID=UPI001FADBAB3|nr:YibE/F family protein [Fundidesulfovibrio agrisoli]
MPISITAKKADIVLTLAFALLTGLLLLLPTGFEERLPQGTLAVKARVLSVDDANVRQYGVVLEGDQRVEARILEGPRQGETVWADNPFLGKLELDKQFKPGDEALVALTLSGGKVASAVAQDHYRLGVQGWLMGLFALFLAVYAGWSGVKALLSFVFAALAIWKVMVPLFLRGADPVPVTLGVLAVLMASVLFLVGGPNRKSLAAYLGSLLGVGATCLMALYFSEAFRLHGSVKAYAETLFYSGYPHLNLTRIFLATVFLGSSGAVMDLAMDVAASMDEVAAHNPDAGFWKLLTSGLRVGRVVVGTMTTTLLLAYSGGSMALLMVFMAQGVPMANVFNMNHVAAEVLNTLVGSFGLVLVAPFTALSGAWLLSRR